jgi:hydroxymethylpyrimidine kinase/phosphomethylpyrimidine kinase
MLFSTEVILAVVGTFEKHWEREDHPPLVIDPVLVSTSGHSLLPESAVAALRDKLLPWATVITPNVPEAEVLSSWEGKISSVEDMRECAKKLGKLGARWIYLKGGHLPLENGGKKVVYDLLWDAREGTEVLSERPYLQSKNTHGTGCTLSAAIASELAKGSTGECRISRNGDAELTVIRNVQYPRLYFALQTSSRLLSRLRIPSGVARVQSTTSTRWDLDPSLCTSPPHPPLPPALNPFAVRPHYLPLPSPTTSLPTIPTHGIATSITPSPPLSRAETLPSLRSCISYSRTITS